MMQDVHVKFYPGFPWDMSKTLLTCKLDLN